MARCCFALTRMTRMPLPLSKLWRTTLPRALSIYAELAKLLLEPVHEVRGVRQLAQSGFNAGEKALMALALGNRLGYELRRLFVTHGVLRRRAVSAPSP